MNKYFFLSNKDCNLLNEKVQCLQSGGLKMKAYQDMNQDELETLHQQLRKQYQDMKDLHLQLNMARGKPDFSQVTATEMQTYFSSVGVANRNKIGRVFYSHSKRTDATRGFFDDSKSARNRRKFKHGSPVVGQNVVTVFRTERVNAVAYLRTHIRVLFVINRTVNLASFRAIARSRRHRFVIPCADNALTPCRVGIHKRLCAGLAFGRDGRGNFFYCIPPGVQI